MKFSDIEVKLCVDCCLQQNISQIPGISSIAFSTKSVWTPEITCYNEVGAIYNEQWTYIPVNITSDGQALWMPGGLLTAICPMHVTYYPFDTQSCDLNFGMWSSDITSQELVNQSFTQDPFAISHNLWDFVKLESIQTISLYDESTAETYSSVKFRLTMKCKPTYYVVNIVVPCAAMSILNLGVFLLPANSGDRVTLGTTTFLSYTVFLLVVHSELPTTSEHFPLICLYLIGLVIISTLVILTNILIIRMHDAIHREIPMCFKSMGMSTTISEACEGSNEQPQQANNVTLWNSFVKKIDNIVFVFFICALTLLTFTYLGLCLSNG